MVPGLPPSVTGAFPRSPISLPDRSAVSLAASSPGRPGEEAVLARWVRATLVACPDEPVALDGKVVRGAKTEGQAAPHLLSFRTHQSQETLFQIRVDDKTNEIPVAQAVLP